MDFCVRRNDIRRLARSVQGPPVRAPKEDFQRFAPRNDGDRGRTTEDRGRRRGRGFFNRFLDCAPVLSYESKNGGFARNDRKGARNDPAPNYPALIRREFALNSCGTQRQTPFGAGQARDDQKKFFFSYFFVDFCLKLVKIPAC